MSLAGLTGGIASGKSTVASMLRELGCHIIDADKIAFDVVQQGEPAWERIVAFFGTGVLLENGQINRAVLGDSIFQDEMKRNVLNSIVHPEVYRVMAEQIDECSRSAPDSVVILDIPLLIETGMHETLPEVILVYVPQEVQIARLMERDKLSYQDALIRIGSQMPIEQKKRFSTIILDNSGSLEQTRKRVKEIYAQLLEKD
ncbi:MAG TPA: dephospho-CoA kinase [Deltaproteobacteria bacterium]|nr:dephospho-CoA kinase [Deltaproteobacteria bacterium]